MKGLFLVSCLALAWAPLGASAQETESADSKEEPVPAATPSAADARIQALEERIQALEAADGHVDEDAEFRAFEAEMAAMQEEVDAATKAERFQFWGFFDLTFTKNFFPKNSPLQFFVSDKTTFLMTNLNLYFKSQMTKKLSAMGELRFSFLPHGQERDYEYELYEKDDSGNWRRSMVTGSYERVSTEVQDPNNTMYYRQGGLMIERIHLTWEAKDWFNVIAGRYLTPYGIWNIDHGSPVVIPIHLPYIQLREMVPPAQTGLQVYGRLFLGRSDLFFDYAVTLSNGHGPAEQVLDYDNNKALGLRLHGSYESPNFRLSMGAYGMMGKYTDHKKVVQVHTTGQGTLDIDSMDMPLQVRVEPIKQMSELIVATDLLMELYGLRLQLEYVWTRWDYDKTGPRYPQESLFAGAPPMTDYFRASNVGNAFYGLLAYDLPLSRWLGDFKIMPYVFFEQNHHDDTLPHAWVTHLFLGLNLKPSPYVTLKLEGMYAKADLDVYGGDNYAISAQMAVSF
jgi:hypothetical protein